MWQTVPYQLRGRILVAGKPNKTQRHLGPRSRCLGVRLCQACGGAANTGSTNKSGNPHHHPTERNTTKFSSRSPDTWRDAVWFFGRNVCTTTCGVPRIGLGRRPQAARGEKERRSDSHLPLHATKYVMGKAATYAVLSPNHANRMSVMSSPLSAQWIPLVKSPSRRMLTASLCRSIGISTPCTASCGTDMMFTNRVFFFALPYRRRKEGTWVFVPYRRKKEKWKNARRMCLIRINYATILGSAYAVSTRKQTTTTIAPKVRTRHGDKESARFDIASFSHEHLRAPQRRSTHERAKQGSIRSPSSKSMHVFSEANMKNTTYLMVVKYM